MAAKYGSRASPAPARPFVSPSFSNFSAADRGSPEPQWIQIAFAFGNSGSSNAAAQREVRSAIQCCHRLPLIGGGGAVMGGGGVTTRLPGRSVPGPAGGGTTVVVPAGGNAGETVPAGGTALVLGTAIPVFGVVVGGVGVVLAPDAGLNPRPPIA